MKKLQLYSTLPQAKIAEVTPLEINHSCELCKLCEGTKTVCMSPEGEAGGVLCISEMPGKIEDQTGRPWSGGSGKYLRQVVKRHWSGKIAIDNALKCAPGTRSFTDKAVDACRPYGAQVVKDTQPQRILAFGNQAIYSVLGRHVPVMSARRGYGWLFDDDGGAIPVFMLMNPNLSGAMRNRFVAAAFEADIKWALTCTIPKTRFEGETWLVETGNDAHQAHDALRGFSIVYDVETFGRMGNADFRVESCTLLASDITKKISWTWTRKALQDPKAVRYLKLILEDSEVVTQNGKYDDRSVLTAFGVDVLEVRSDTRLFRKLLDFETSAALGVMAELVGMGGHKTEASDKIDAISKELRYQANPPSGLTPTGKKRKVKDPAFDVPQSVLDQMVAGEDAMAFSFGFLDDETLYRYNARDVFSTRAVESKLAPQLEAQPNIRRVWDVIVRDASKAIRWIEHWGIAIDRGAIEHFADYCKAKEVEHTQKLSTYVPQGFNYNSPVQLSAFLFDKLKLRPTKTTKSGRYSTDAEVLEELRGQHQSVDHILQLRKYGKLNGTYATGMQVHIRDDSRIHASYLLDGAGTGRLSSADPNMQNIPRAKGNPEGKMLRDCFIAPKGFVLVEADQSQIELRVAAMLSQDRNMMADYKAGIDIHANNARECCEIVWGISRAKWDKMTKEERDPFRTQIKTTTFGKLYGKTDAGLAMEFGCDRKQVEAINKKIWGRYSQLASWIKTCVAFSQRTGETWTWWDGQDARRRRVWGVADQDEAVRQHAERTAYNTRIQGTAADFTTASLWPIISWILGEGVPAMVIATIHDSILVQAHKTVLDEVVQKMNAVMTGWPAQGVPLVAEFKVGERWGSMEEHKV